MFRPVRTFVLALAVVVPVAACGVDGASSPTKSDFLTKGNAVCRRMNDRLKQLGEHVPLDSEAKAGAYLKEKMAPVQRKAISDLRALGYPEGDRDRLDAMYRKVDDLIDRIEKDPVAVMNDRQLNASVNQEFRDYGLTTCAQ